MHLQLLCADLHGEEAFHRRVVPHSHCRVMLRVMFLGFSFDDVLAVIRGVVSQVT